MRHRRPSRAGTALFWFTIWFLIILIGTIIGVAIGLRFL